jgi:uncharacterized protein
MTSDRCPTCQERCPPRSENLAFPFCSRRCQMIDLGNWLDDAYRIAGPPAGSDDQPE